MKILHSEASAGWGGQEIRSLEEACGMRERGHEIIFAVQKKAALARVLRERGFVVYELCFSKKSALTTFWKLSKIIRLHKIELINTHSSLDSWIAGFVGKWLGKKVVRTRHLSGKIRSGLNSRLLYNFLASHVVTTCAEIVSTIQKQARLPDDRITSVPTGLDSTKMQINHQEVVAFRAKYGIAKDDFVVGTACVFRGWKGIEDLLLAAKLLQHEKKIKFLLVGSGVSEGHFKEVHRRLGLEESVFFTGYLPEPFIAMAAMDLFVLLSREHEGVSQAVVQAAYLERPLLTTRVGGLKEVCRENESGLLVESHSPEKVAEAIVRLMKEPALRKEMGRRAKTVVEKEFLFETMLDKMERVYGSCRRI